MLLLAERAAARQALSGAEWPCFMSGNLSLGKHKSNLQRQEQSSAAGGAEVASIRYQNKRGWDVAAGSTQVMDHTMVGWAAGWGHKQERKAEDGYRALLWRHAAALIADTACVLRGTSQRAGKLLSRIVQNAGRGGQWLHVGGHHGTRARRQAISAVSSCRVSSAAVRKAAVTASSASSC